MNKRPATIKDVAVAAGVSTATVSMILNGRYQFRPELEARVRAAVEALNYRQNPGARSMATGSFGSVGVLALDIRNPYFTNVVHGASLQAQARGYKVVMVDLKEDVSQAEQTVDDLARRVDGLILSMRLPTPALELPGKLGKPVVFFGQVLEGLSESLPSDSVQIQGREAAMLLARHIIQTGRNRITYVGYSHSRWNADRLAALREIAAPASINELLVDAQTMEAGEAIAASLVYGTHKADAIVCYNDVIAIGVLHGLHRLGIRVPEDISLAGFDDIPVSRFLTPGLTTVDMRSEDLGSRSMIRLHELIEGDTSGKQIQVLEPRLVVRGSTLIAGE